MKRLLLWLATAVVVLYAILAISYRYLSPEPTAALRESYAVYSAYLLQTAAGAPVTLGEDAAPIVILDHTTCPFRLCLSPRISGADRFLRIELAIENLQSTPIENRLDPRLHYALAPSTSTAIFGVPEFSRSYGQITFSALSFDRHLTRALFYSERLCGLCGGAHFILMHKVDGRWLVEAEAANWVS